MPTIPEVLAVAARRRPHAEALVDGETRLTYQALDARVNQVADALGTRGLVKGDRVLLMAGNSQDFVYAYFGALRLGAIVVPVNPASAPRELEYLADDSGATMLVIDEASVTRLGADALPALRAGALALRPDPALDDLTTLAAAASEPPPTSA